MLSDHGSPNLVFADLGAITRGCYHFAPVFDGMRQRSSPTTCTSSLFPQAIQQQECFRHE
jgi:hypothetical protein